MTYYWTRWRRRRRISTAGLLVGLLQLVAVIPKFYSVDALDIPADAAAAADANNAPDINDNLYYDDGMIYNASTLPNNSSSNNNDHNGTLYYNTSDFVDLNQSKYAVDSKAAYFGVSRSTEDDVNYIVPGWNTGGEVEESNNQLLMNKNENWMSQLSDSFRFSELSIPGTHNSMHYSNNGGPAAQCQTMDLKTQLIAGIRFLDIRARHYNNGLSIHHGFIYLDTNFHSVLRVVTSFLLTNNKETIYLRLKEEHTTERNSKSYDQVLSEYLGTWYSRFVYTGNNKSNPSLGETRGKIVILGEFDGDGDSKWVTRRWSSLDIQDMWRVNLFKIQEKKQKIANHLTKAMNGGSYYSVYINFLSGTAGLFPSTVASYTNPYAMNTIKSARRSNGPKRIGIVVSDFPGEGLIESIIEMNDFFRKDPAPGGPNSFNYKTCQQNEDCLSGYCLSSLTNFRGLKFCCPRWEVSWLSIGGYGYYCKSTPPPSPQPTQQPTPRPSLRPTTTQKPTPHPSPKPTTPVPTTPDPSPQPTPLPTTTPNPTTASPTTNTPTMMTGSPTTGSPTTTSPNGDGSPDNDNSDDEEEEGEEEESQDHDTDSVDVTVDDDLEEEEEPCFGFATKIMRNFVGVGRNFGVGGGGFRY